MPEPSDARELLGLVVNVCSIDPEVFEIPESHGGLREAVGIDGREQSQNLNEGVDPLVRRRERVEPTYQHPRRQVVAEGVEEVGLGSVSPPS